MTDRRRRTLLAAAAAIAIAACAAFALAKPPPITAAYLDFNAFYCGAEILAGGGDPYRYEPLHSCESRNLRPVTPNAAVPVPLPPYAIAAFAPFSHLGYPRAQLLWWMILVASGLLLIWTLVELSELPLLLVATCVLVSMLLPSLAVGSLALPPIALLSCSALALKRGAWSIAAVLQGAACIEPHVAVPVLIATFCFSVPMRGRLALVAAAILSLSLVAGRGGLNAEYVTRVLPAHAVSEIGNAEQYGVSAILYSFGLGERASVAIANAQYLAFVLAGLWLVARLRLAMPESAVVVPMALAVTGGPFVHVTQIGAAIPLALVLAARTRSVLAWAGLALVAMAIPWQASIGFGDMLAGLVLFAVLFTAGVPILGVLASSIAAGALLRFLQAPELVRPGIAAIAAVPPSALTEVAWRELADQFPPTAFSLYGHVLVYAGLLCICWAALRFARVSARA